MVEPSIEYGPSSLIGPLNMDGSGVVAGMKIGANLAGLPAISVPCGFAQGLPAGMQIIGPHFGEERLLNVAHRFQLETDWHRRTPPGFA